MKIVVLDGFTLNPGDLSWEAVAALGELTVYDRTPSELTIERATGAEMVLTNKVVLSATEIAALPDLRYIGVLATGVNVVDLAAAAKAGICVTNIPAYSTPSVAQHVFALILELTRAVGHHSRRVHNGAWVQSADFAFWETPQTELAGKTLGLIGLGGIGQKVAQIAQAFDMKLLIHTRTPRQQDWPEATFVELDQLFMESDIVSLHCPLTSETTKLVNAKRLAQMKQSAYLINTGRGPLINEAALAKALHQGKIAGAGLDVLSTEPPLPDNPLLQSPNCLITPHLAWATLAARQRLMDTVAANIKSYLQGAETNRVN